jgi:hypothetical protein
MGISYNPKIVTDGLVLCLDAANPKSYPGSGTTWFDLTKNQYNSSMVGVNFNSNGYMSFPGTGESDSAPVGEYVTLNTTATTTSPSTKPSGVTYNVWMRFTANQLTGHGIFYGSTTINHIEFRASDVTNGYWRTEAVTQNGYSFGGGGTNADGGHALGEWFNLTIVFANNESSRPVRWYRNGQLFHVGNMTSGSNPSGEYFEPNAFGRSTGTDTYKYVESFKGDMSTLSIYDKVISESEIQQNFNAIRGRFGV